MGQRSETYRLMFAALIAAFAISACGSTTSSTPTSQATVTAAPSKLPQAPTPTPVPLPTLLALPDAADGLRISAPFRLARLYEATAASIESAVLNAMPDVMETFEFGARGAADDTNNGAISSFLAVIRLGRFDVSSPTFLDALATRIRQLAGGDVTTKTVSGTVVRIVNEPTGGTEIVFGVGDRAVWCFGTTKELELRVAKAIIDANPEPGSRSQSPS
jgi:hypothetical protein